MVAIAAAVLVAFIGGLYFITHHKKEEAEAMQNRQAAGNGLPPKPEERWRYIKELESRQPGVRAPTEPTAGGEVMKPEQLTDEQRQLLAQMQAAFSQEREIGTDVLVRGAVRKEMNLSVKVRVEPGYEPADVSARCEASLREFLEALPLGSQLLAAQIGDRLFHVEGVENYMLLSPSEDVLLSADVKLTPGTIHVEPMG